MTRINRDHSKRPRTGDVFKEFAVTLWYLRAMIVGMFLLFVALTIVMYYFGGPVETWNRKPSPFGETIYFCAVTALTVGFGDVVPTTPLGRIDAVALGMLGLLMGGLLVASAVRGVQEAWRRATGLDEL